MHQATAAALVSKTKDVSEMMSSNVQKAKAVNREYLSKVLQNIVFLARQGLAMRGNWVPSNSLDCAGGSEFNSNFHQLLLLRSKDDPHITEILERKTHKYTDHSIQDEFLKLISRDHLHQIEENIKGAGYFAIECDEVTDSSNREQVIVCFRWVDNAFEPHEDFMGLCSVADITAQSVFQVVRDAVIRMNLSMNMCRAQCYDGAANMKRVATMVKEIEPRSLYLHCHGHSLNLAVADVIKKIPTMSNALDHTLEICKLIKFSPRRDAIFNRVKEELTPGLPGLRNLCPTRWTVRALSLESVRRNFTALQTTWEEALDVVKDTEVKARITGVAAKMKEFDFLFGLMLAEKILKHTDNLSKTLQSTSMTAADSYHVATLCNEVLSQIRTEECFTLFWGLVKKNQESIGINEPIMPRRRKRPARFESGTAEPHFPVDVQEFYRRIYYEAIDTVVVAIENRFMQKDFSIYGKLEQLLLQATKKEDYTDTLKDVTDFYRGDFNRYELATQLEAFSAMNIEKNGNSITFHDIHKHFKILDHNQHLLMPQVVKVVKLVLLMPATNAVSERSASAMRRIKTYLRSTMTQCRLNNVMVLHIHKHLTDNLNYIKILNEFTSAIWTL